MKKLWFKNKRYGYGWTPASLEGWLVTVLFVVYNFWSFFKIDFNSPSISQALLNFLLKLTLSIVILVIICIAKGERPKWNWGDSKKDI